MKRHGEGAELLVGGWLTQRAAADALGISVRQLLLRADDGKIESKHVGPGVRLYNVRRRAA